MHAGSRQGDMKLSVQEHPAPALRHSVIRLRTAFEVQRGAHTGLEKLLAQQP